MFKNTCCSICLCINKKTINIYDTDLQYVYEKLANFKVKPELCFLCYICRTRLRQFVSLQKTASSSQSQPLVHLTTRNIEIETIPYNVLAKEEPREFDVQERYFDSDVTIQQEIENMESLDSKENNGSHVEEKSCEGLDPKRMRVRQSFLIGVVDDGSSGSLLRDNPLERPLHQRRQRLYQFYDESANVLIDLEDNMADVEMEPARHENISFSALPTQNEILPPSPAAFETYGGSAPGTPSSALSLESFGGSSPGTSKSSQRMPPSSAPSTSTSKRVPPSSRRTLRLDEIDYYVNHGSEDDSDSSSDEEGGLFATFVPRSQRIFFDLGDDIDSPDSPAAPSPSQEPHASGEAPSVVDVDQASPAVASPSQEPQASGEVSSIVASPEDWRPKGLFDFTWERFPSNPVPPNERREAFRSENVGPADIFPSPYEAFVAIWTPDFVEKIAAETNRYAQQLTDRKLREGGLGPNSRITNWKDVTADTIYVYFALITATGITIKTDIKEYWAKDEITWSPFFSRYMSYNNFLLINMCLHFVDNSNINIQTLTRPQAKLYKIQPVVQHLNSRFQELYNLNKNIALDESLTEWKGWLSIKQYIKNKSAGIGVKTYEVCDSSTGYLWRFKVHAGREEGAVTQDLGYISNLVLELLEGLENKGHCVWMDNFYNSPALARVLKSKGFDCVGTLRTNRQGVPAEIKQLKKSDMTVGQISGCTSGDVDIVVWRDANRVAMISTYHGAAVHTAEMKTKPIVVYDYNVCMGGVDRKDQMLSTYPLERKRTRIWYKKFFKRLLNVSILNAFVLHRDSGTGHIRQHRAFRKELVLQLLQKHHRQDASIDIVPRTLRKRGPLLSQEVLSHFLKQYGLVPNTTRNERIRHSCVLCHKRQSTYCPACNVPLCIDCSVVYHS